MRADLIFDLQDWIERNRGWIMKERPTLKEIRERAESEFNPGMTKDDESYVKCPESALKACMERLDIPVKRSKAESELILLRKEKQELEELVIELWNQANLPPELAQSFRHRIEKLGGRILAVIKRQNGEDAA